MRIPTQFRSTREGLDATMTPMIDVVFLLLVFFVWTASFQIVEYALPSDLAIAAGATNSSREIDPDLVDFERVVVRIGWSDDRPIWIVNERAVADLNKVRDLLATVYSIRADTPVILDPHQDVPLGVVIDVYDLVRLVGFSKVRFTAESIL